jgi:hypothetical protein
MQISSSNLTSIQCPSRLVRLCSYTFRSSRNALLFFFWAIGNFQVNQANFKRSPSTPIAVTAAPAPAPCTIKGRGLYLSVWSMIMLSDPPREVANGWSLGYLQRKLTKLGILTQRTTYFSRPALT